MAVAIIHDAWTRVACLYDNTTDTAFGPVFTGPDAGTNAEMFLEWLEENGPIQGCSIVTNHVAAGGDPRDYLPAGLRKAYELFNEEQAREPAH